MPADEPWERPKVGPADDQINNALREGQQALEAREQDEPALIMEGPLKLSRLIEVTSLTVDWR